MLTYCVNGPESLTVVDMNDRLTAYEEENNQLMSDKEMMQDVFIENNEKREEPFSVYKIVTL